MKNILYVFFIAIAKHRIDDTNCKKYYDLTNKQMNN